MYFKHLIPSQVQIISDSSVCWWACLAIYLSFCLSHCLSSTCPPCLSLCLYFDLCHVSLLSYLACDLLVLVVTVGFSQLCWWCSFNLVRYLLTHILCILIYSVLILSVAFEYLVVRNALYSRRVEINLVIVESMVDCF